MEKSQAAVETSEVGRRARAQAPIVVDALVEDRRPGAGDLAPLLLHGQRDRRDLGGDEADRGDVGEPRLRRAAMTRSRLTGAWA